MKLTISDLHTERQWRSATGLTEAQFKRLLISYEKSYEGIYGRTIKERTSESPNNPSLTNYIDLLLFTLFSLKSGLTYDLLGFVTGIDGSNAKRNQTLGIEILKSALSELGLLPERSFGTLEDFRSYFENQKTLILDVTEQRVQRPQAGEVQQSYYSGKKNAIH